MKCYKGKNNKGIDGEFRVGNMENMFKAGHSVWIAVHIRIRCLSMMSFESNSSQRNDVLICVLYGVFFLLFCKLQKVL